MVFLLPDAISEKEICVMLDNALESPQTYYDLVLSILMLKDPEGKKRFSYTKMKKVFNVPDNHIKDAIKYFMDLGETSHPYLASYIENKAKLEERVSSASNLDVVKEQKRARAREIMEILYSELGEAKKYAIGTMVSFSNGEKMRERNFYSYSGEVNKKRNLWISAIECVTELIEMGFNSMKGFLDIRFDVFYQSDKKMITESIWKVFDNTEKCLDQMTYEVRKCQ